MDRRLFLKGIILLPLLTNSSLLASTKRVRFRRVKYAKLTNNNTQSRITRKYYYIKNDKTNIAPIKHSKFAKLKSIRDNTYTDYIPKTKKTCSVNIKDFVAHFESRGKIHLVNRFGYMGKYQMGMLTLADQGVMSRNVIKRLTKQGFKQSSIIKEPTAWNNGYSLNDFLSNEYLQERVYSRYVKDGFKHLARKGVDTNNMDGEDKAGAQAGMQFGFGNLTNYLKYNQDFKDGNGYKISKLVEKGRKYYRDKMV